MDGGLTQSNRSLTMVGESIGETAEDPGSSSGNGDKRCGRRELRRPIKAECLTREVQA